MNAKSLIIFPLLLVSLAASANFSATDTNRILNEQKEIRRESEQPMGKYSRFDDQAQARLHKAQDVIFKILADGKALEQLNKEQQVDLLNAVEEVKAVIAGNEQDKLECWRERKIGTTLKVTRCETVAQRARIMEESREWKSDTSICIPQQTASSCGQVR